MNRTESQEQMIQSMGIDGAKRAPWASSSVVCCTKRSHRLELLCVKVRPKGAMSSLRETVSNGPKPALVDPLQLRHYGDQERIDAAQDESAKP